jgi:uncharacterized membrane protein YhiD involved in acid resistance
MNETIIVIISTSTVTIALMMLVVFLLKNWILRKIQYAVKFEYDKKIEELKEENAKRSKANLIADLLSEWLSFPTKQKNLNKLTFEAFLWLPKPIASRLSKLLTHKPDSPNTREIINDVRNYLLQDEEKLDANEIIIFTQESKIKSKKNNNRNDKDKR